jgi:hypothetical protein
MNLDKFLSDFTVMKEAKEPISSQERMANAKKMIQKGEEDPIYARKYRDRIEKARRFLEKMTQEMMLKSTRTGEEPTQTTDEPSQDLGDLDMGVGKTEKQLSADKNKLKQSLNKFNAKKEAVKLVDEFIDDPVGFLEIYGSMEVPLELKDLYKDLLDMGVLTGVFERETGELDTKIKEIIKRQNEIKMDYVQGDSGEELINVIRQDEQISNYVETLKKISRERLKDTGKLKFFPQLLAHVEALSKKAKLQSGKDAPKKGASDEIFSTSAALHNVIGNLSAIKQLEKTTGQAEPAEKNRAFKDAMKNLFVYLGEYIKEGKKQITDFLKRVEDYADKEDVKKEYKGFLNYVFGKTSNIKPADVALLFFQEGEPLLKAFFGGLGEKKRMQQNKDIGHEVWKRIMTLRDENEELLGLSGEEIKSKIAKNKTFKDEMEKVIAGTVGLTSVSADTVSKKGIEYVKQTENNIDIINNFLNAIKKYSFQKIEKEDIDRIRAELAPLKKPVFQAVLKQRKVLDNWDENLVGLAGNMSTSSKKDLTSLQGQASKLRGKNKLELKAMLKDKDVNNNTKNVIRDLIELSDEEYFLVMNKTEEELRAMLDNPHLEPESKEIINNILSPKHLDNALKDMKDKAAKAKEEQDLMKQTYLMFADPDDKEDMSLAGVKGLEANEKAKSLFYKPSGFIKNRVTTPEKLEAEINKAINLAYDLKEIMLDNLFAYLLGPIYLSKETSEFFKDIENSEDKGKFGRFGELNIDEKEKFLDRVLEHPSIKDILNPTAEVQESVEEIKESTVVNTFRDRLKQLINE